MFIEDSSLWLLQYGLYFPSFDVVNNEGQYYVCYLFYIPWVLIEHMGAQEILLLDYLIIIIIV